VLLTAGIGKQSARKELDFPANDQSDVVMAAAVDTDDDGATAVRVVRAYPTLTLKFS
jgi:hypothetical protein